ARQRARRPSTLRTGFDSCDRLARTLACVDSGGRRRWKRDAARRRTFLMPMKKFLPFVIIIVVLAAAVGLSLVVLKGKRGAVNSSSTFATTGPTPTGPAANQPTQSSAGLTKPNVKVSSPVV